MPERAEAIAVTGLGVLAPNGVGVDAFWRACAEGRSGIRRLRHTDTDGLDVAYGGELPEIDFSVHFSRREQGLFDVSQLAAAVAAAMALDDARLEPGGAEADATGVVIGTGVGTQSLTLEHARAFAERGPVAVSPYHALTTPSGCATLAARTLGLGGPVFGAVAACATAAYSLIAGAALIRTGDAEVVLAGAVDAIRSATLMAGFANMRSLARHEDPARASRPLDRGRNGFVVSEGAAVFVLERPEHAYRRRARIYGHLRGHGMASDRGNMIASEAEGTARACRLALERAGLSGDEIEHLSLHAAGTVQGDQAEADGLHAVLGPRAADVPATAPKSMFGHAMGAAAGLESVLALKTLQTGMIPPTINLDDPDPAIRLNAVRQPRRLPVRTVLKTSAGLGGVHAALVFESPSA